MSLSRDLLSNYVRRLTATTLLHAATFIGPNDNEAAWVAAREHFAAEYRDLDPPPPFGQVPHPRGGIVEYDLTYEAPNTIEIKVHDWDQALRNQLETWKWARQVVRWWVPCSHFAVGRISQVADDRPAKGLLAIQLQVRGIFFYDTDDSDVINAPFPNTTKLVTDGRLWGAQA